MFVGFLEKADRCPSIPLGVATNEIMLLLGPHFEEEYKDLYCKYRGQDSLVKSTSGFEKAWILFDGIFAAKLSALLSYIRTQCLVSSFALAKSVVNMLFVWVSIEK
ncbi:Hypothetical predicted protein [Olea europaea subsp. europaea]|uniref:Uncharacterized protein n=1 Tax=Olea europaea subsp. europaea TaxID=158383 RepID=A0A8S0RAR3_OLEEU|nr:Hypothetical predicted protein [Olea europaea subsp. europaea]